jgi:hypothetical protein
MQNLVNRNSSVNLALNVEVIRNPIFIRLFVGERGAWGVIIYLTVRPKCAYCLKKNLLIHLPSLKVLGII